MCSPSSHERVCAAFPYSYESIAEECSGLPYFKFLKREGKEDGRDVSRADFVVMQREALENYLRGLIRAVVRI